MELGAGGKGVVKVSHTSGEAFGKAAVSSYLKTDFKPISSATQSHTHTHSFWGNPKLLGPDRQDLTGASGEGRKVA